MSLEEELTQLNIDIGEAEKVRHRDMLDRILANDLIFRRASGIVIDKATYLEELLKPENTYDYLCSEVIEIKLNKSQNVAIVTLHVRAKGQRGNNSFEGIYRNIRYFRKKGKDWQCYKWLNKTLEARENREYDSSPLPVLGGNVETADRTQILLSLYGEVCNNFRMLTDVRFKLLGLVPTVSVAVLISLLSQKPDEGLSPSSQIFISGFGLLITIGIGIYDQRNTKLYIDLIRRGHRIEEELGIDTGQFRGRLDSHFLINHKIAILIIYLTAVGGWLSVLVLAIYESLGLVP